MSYYENPQWPVPNQPNWDRQGASTPVRSGASGPQPQDDFAFSHQFDDVDRAYENLQKSGKGYGMGGRQGRMSHGGGHRNHPSNHFDDARGPRGGPDAHNFYATQRHQPSRGSNEAEQVMQAKRRMAAQRERELRNLHTEQQYQRNSAVADMTLQGNKHMSEEETRELIARQRSALYGEGPFSDKGGYMDETGNMRPGGPGTSGPSSLRGPSPMAFDNLRGTPSGEAGTPNSSQDPSNPLGDPSPRPQSTSSPQTGAPANKILDNAAGGSQSRTSTSSPSNNTSPPRDLAPGSKPPQSSVAPIGTRPSGTPTSTSSNKRSPTPHGSSGGWGRGSGVWGQASGLGTQASVWG